MENQAKIWFNLDGDPVAGETVWAEAVGEGLYQLMSIPFYIKGYALGDVVRCHQIEGNNEIVSLEADSGNGVIRIYFHPLQENEIEHILRELISIGCQYEKASPTLFAVSIPYNVEIPFSQMAKYLNSIENNVIIGWEIGKRINRNVD